MLKSATIIGIGEIGGVFAKGCLKQSYTVTPVNRSNPLERVLPSNTDLIINTVGEKDLESTLQNFPTELSNKLVLVQNELLPVQWEKFGLNPTVISIWFEKKPGKDAKQIIPSPIFGSKAEQITQILASVGLNTKIVTSKDALLFELVLKNVYILTTNICGLTTKGNVGDLKDNHVELMTNIFNEVVTLQEALTNSKFDRALLMSAMIDCFDGDLTHMCMGRSAPVRLERAKKFAAEFNLSLPNISKF